MDISIKRIIYSVLSDTDSGLLNTAKQNQHDILAKAIDTIISRCQDEDVSEFIFFFFLRVSRNIRRRHSIADCRLQWAQETGIHYYTKWNTKLK